MKPVFFKILAITVVVWAWTDSVWGITVFTVNGQTELVLVGYGEPLRFTADVSRPGGSLAVSIYYDLNGNKAVDESDFELDSTATIVDGGVATETYPIMLGRDGDGVANGEINVILGDPYLISRVVLPAPFFTLIRAVDADGSSATVALRVEPKEFNAIVKGKMMSPTGDPVPNVLIIDMPQIMTFAAEPFFPIFAVSDEDGEFVMSVPRAVHYVLTRKPGYYSDEMFQLNVSDEVVELILEMKPDSTPPKLVHTPPERVYVGRSVTFKAIASDDESGVGFTGIDTFSLFRASLNYRPLGSDEPFKRISMYGDAFLLEPWMPAESKIIEGVSDGMGHPNKEIELSCYLSSEELGTDGIEYYISVSDNAGNSSRSPEQPSELHKVVPLRSNYVISGKVTYEDGTPAQGIMVTGFAINYRDIPWDDIAVMEPDLILPPKYPSEVSTETGSDGVYRLHVEPGTWQIWLQLPEQHYVVSPKEGYNKIAVVEERDYGGYDYVIGRDERSPVIVHNPSKDVQAGNIGDPVVIQAKITDNTGTPKAVLILISGAFGEMKYEMMPIGDDLFIAKIPGELICSDLKYYIQAYDPNGNISTLPAENPEANPFVVELPPAEYQIVGVIRDAETGLGIAEVSIAAQTPTGEYRKTATDANGGFTLPVKPGVWHLEIYKAKHGIVSDPETLEISIKEPGSYEVEIEMLRDEDAPVISHDPLKSVDLGDRIVILANVTDKTSVESVNLCVLNEWGYQYFPMRTTAGKLFAIDMSSLSLRLPADQMTIRYFIQAVDVAGNRSRYPSDDQVVEVGLKASASVTGRVTLDGNPVAKATIIGEFGRSLYFYDYTDSDGRYSLPATAGLNFISLEDPRYLPVSPRSGVHLVFAEEGETVTGIDFEIAEENWWEPRWFACDLDSDGEVTILDLVAVTSNFGVEVASSKTAYATDESGQAGAFYADVNADGSVNIFDVVLVAQNLGRTRDQGNDRDESMAPRLYSDHPATLSVRPVSFKNGVAEFEISISAMNVYGFQLDLSLPESVEITGVEKGGFLSKNGGNTFWNTPTVEGNVASFIAEAILGDDPVSGDGAVALISARLPSGQDTLRVEMRNLLIVERSGLVIPVNLQPALIRFNRIDERIETALLQNFPNPFNPETWIPFRLADTFEVKIKIFNALGQLVREIDLGEMPKGVYATKERAAYWDGRNNFGEKVSSGIYFYSIEAGDFRATRRMIITK